MCEGVYLKLVLFTVVSVIATEDPCHDTLDTCSLYGPQACTHEVYRPWAMSHCRLFCNFCTPATPVACQDKRRNCKEFDDGNLCTKAAYLTWARENCFTYCGFHPCDTNRPTNVVTSPVSTTLQHKTNNITAPAVVTDHPNTGCDDIAIVGAGIAGTYAAWKLRNTNQSITIYEYSNRVGGRIFITQITGVPDFYADLGAMRFEPENHPRLNKSVHELGLKALNFDHIAHGKTDNTLLFLRGSQMRYKDIIKNGIPYNLRPEETTTYNQLRWEAYVNNTDKLMNNASDNYHVKTRDGIPIYKQSMNSVLFKSVSTEAEEFILAVDGFYGDYNKYSAVISYPRSNPADESNEPVATRTVEHGMAEIPKALLKEFLLSSSQHEIILNRQLTAVTKQQDGSYLLKFMLTITSNGETSQINIERKQCAKKVILAINRLPLETLDWSGLRQPHIRDFITNAVQDVHAAKIFFAYANPWWRKAVANFSFAVSDTPLRMTYDFRTMNESKVSILNVGYMDYDVSLWDELRQRGNPIQGAAGDPTLSVTDEMVTVINKFLAQIFNVSVNDIPQPVGAIMKIWKSFPYGGSWQNWMPGYVWTDVERQMVKPSPNDEVYIASNAFNGRTTSWWGEGALETVDLMLDRMHTG